MASISLQAHPRLYQLMARLWPDKLLACPACLTVMETGAMADARRGHPEMHDLPSSSNLRYLCNFLR